jgi:hypothetical protein
MLPVSNIRKIGKDVGANLAASNCNAPKAIKVNKAVCETRRAPKRSTMRELVKFFGADMFAMFG